ncbi:Transmembrane protein 184C [Apodemus speciosus]|uniref:Transmembrane protein 184C n=1 Tax=Apodemus speciosus TaxID=105296 RepID=A0ABQ0F2L5_APOSI
MSDIPSGSSKLPSPVGLYQGFTQSHHRAQKNSRSFLLEDKIAHMTSQNKQQKLLDSGQHILINIPEEQMEITDHSFHYLVETVNSQALFSSELSEDSVIDMLGSLH